MQIQRIQEQKRDHRHVASKNNEIVAVYKSRERRIQREREREINPQISGHENRDTRHEIQKVG